MCRRIVVGLLAVLLAWVWVFPLQASAADALGELAAAGELSLPDTAETVLSEAGITADSPTSVLELSPRRWFAMLWDTLKTEAFAPISLLAAFLTLLFLTAVLGGVNDMAASGSLRGVLDFLCVLICVGTAAAPFCSCLKRTADALTEGSIFMGSFIPVFSGFLAAGGSAASGSTYQMLVFFLTELMQQLNGHFLFPLLEAAAALGIADAVNPSLRLGGLVQGIRRAVTWLLGFLMTAFATLLSIRSFVADAADGIAVRTVRLVTSGLIPVVGGAVSEAYGSVQGSIRLMQSGTGVLGILAIVWLTVPPILSVVSYRAVFGLAGIAAELTGTDAIRKFCRDAENVLAAAFAMLVTYAVMLIFSTALMLLMMDGG